MSDFYIYPNHTGPTYAIDIDEELCVGCNSCANICRVQTILPNPDRGEPPVVAYPDECWYCGCCVESCPTGALMMRLPINQRVLFKDRETGEVFRIGVDDSPEKSFFKAPFGWLNHSEFGRLMKELENPLISVNIIISEKDGMKIGRLFGEKEEIDNTEKLVRFLKLVGFDQVFIAERGFETLKQPGLNVSTEQSGKKADIVMNTKDLADLLKRLCVSNYTAVHTWKKI